MLDFYEFFAGGGMVRAGLGPGWRCLFANDFDHKKGRIYQANWGDGQMKVGDVGTLTTRDLPGFARLVWASFPCQDLSLAGGGAGLRGERSGTFWPFWKLTQALIEEDRAPDIIALENVCGTLTSHEGQDFIKICAVVAEAGYSFGAVVVDAALFVPQSRPRLFVICVRKNITVGSRVSNAPVLPWHSPALRTAYSRLPHLLKDKWIWWNPIVPAQRSTTLADLIEPEPRDVGWFSEEETNALLSKMSDVNRAKLELAQRHGSRMIGGLYRRTRRDEFGRKVQRAEIRFDDVSGCLRTPAGGSSRQVILVVDGRSIGARLISSRAAA